MGMDLYIYGIRDVTVVGHPEIVDKQWLVFHDTWQTGTNATMVILGEEDKKAAYIEWVMKRLENNDNPENREDIKKHIEDFELFLSVCEKGYYKVKYEMI